MIGYLLLIHLGKDKPNSVWIPLMVDLNANLPEESDKQSTFFYLHGEKRSSDELKYEMDLFIKNNPNYAHAELKWQRVEMFYLSNFVSDQGN